jgi:hypothetical protein
MRFCTYTWPFTFGVRLGWASAWNPNPPAAPARGRVYLLRGNGIFFSNGLGLLCDRLRGRGVWAEDLRCVGDRWACRHLLADRRAGRLRGPVVFVGHSCGGRYSLFAAHLLQRFGITIDLLVCLDVALPPDVPANVRRAVNIYLSRRRIYPARPLRAVDPARTAVVNLDLSEPGWSLRGLLLNHLTLTDSPAVQALVLRQALRTVAASDPRTPAAA